MNNKQRLELTWIGKETQPLLEPRILIEDPDKSFGDKTAENMLIHGDNLLALKGLEQRFSGVIKCVYIDAPFNTGQAFEHYDDSLEHSLWLNLIYPRLRLLHILLANDGLMWVHLDDSEVHYCKVMLDEIFGRPGFVSHITYERSGVAGLGQGGFLVNTTEHILLYKKDELPKGLNLGFYDLDVNTMKRYNRILVDVGKKELIQEFTAKSNGLPVRMSRHKDFIIKSVSLKDFGAREEEIRELFAQNLKRLFRGNRIQKENEFQNDLLKRMDKNHLYSVEYTPSRGKHEGKLTTLFYYNRELLSWLGDNAEVIDGRIVKSQRLTTLWDHADIPKADIANEGGVKFPRGKKPEQLLKRIIEISTAENDWVLDSFLGSGTTAATAQKLRRKWIGIELGPHCDTHCLPRLRAVCDGTDETGITKGQVWKGGGGFKYYYLAPSLLLQDGKGNWVINRQYNAAQLAAAMAKHEGFRFEPDDTCYWKQGRSTEKDFIFTTTNFVSLEKVDAIYGEMNKDESLLICCTSFSRAANKYDNITIKKIPKMLLGRCEFGRDDYSLIIVNVPQNNGQTEFIPTGPRKDNATRPKGKRKQSLTMDLFSGVEAGKE